MVGFCVGSPLGAACSSYVVRTAEAEVLLDCGPGALERLWRRGTLARLDAVIVSHMHQDHMLDLVPLSNQITRAPGAIAARTVYTSTCRGQTASRYLPNWPAPSTAIRSASSPPLTCVPTTPPIG